VDFRRYGERQLARSLEQETDLASLYVDALAAISATIDCQPPPPLHEKCLDATIAEFFVTR